MKRRDRIATAVGIYQVLLAVGDRCDLQLLSSATFKILIMGVYNNLGQILDSPNSDYHNETESSYCRDAIQMILCDAPELFDVLPEEHYALFFSNSTIGQMTNSSVLSLAAGAA